MMNALYSAATGMAAQQLGMDVIANNLANVNTTGYKASRITFEDLMYQQIGDRQAARLGSQVGMGVAPGRTGIVFTQGALAESEIETSMAIEGNGFFQVWLPNGQIGYTRDGSFQLDANGQLVNSSGYILEPSIVVPIDTDPQTLQISATGRVIARVGGIATVLGQIDIATFTNPAGLVSAGNNTYLATVNSGEPNVVTPGTGGAGFVKQFMLEGSNVSVMQEMVDMLTAQRAFESVAKVISASDEMLGMANALRR